MTKVSIATGSFYSFTNSDFAYLQKAYILGNELIIFIKDSDRAKIIKEHIQCLKISKYIMIVKDDKENLYEDEIARLIGYSNLNPDQINLIYVENPSEKNSGLKSLCEQNGVSYIV